LTLTAPKQMLPIVEQAMVERVLGHLAAHGIDEAVLSLGYRPDAFSDAFPDGVTPSSPPRWTRRVPSGSPPPTRGSATRSWS